MGYGLGARDKLTASPPQFIFSYSRTAETKLDTYKRKLEAWAEDQGLLLRDQN